MISESYSKLLKSSIHLHSITRIHLHTLTHTHTLALRRQGQATPYLSKPKRLSTQRALSRKHIPREKRRTHLTTRSKSIPRVNHPESRLMPHRSPGPENGTTAGSPDLTSWTMLESRTIRINLHSAEVVHKTTRLSSSVVIRHLD
jgi:hypothetical protein